MLGVSPAASEDEVAAAYRELAKAWHPDRRGEDGHRADGRDQRRLRAPAGGRPARAAALAGTPRRRRAGGGAAPRSRDAVRRALGPELVEALGDGERVQLVTPASTWASPRTILALTDRRLLWLLDDAPVARVRTLPLRDVAEVARRARRRRGGTSRRSSVRTTSGRRHSFAELRPHTAATIERHVREARA